MKQPYKNLGHSIGKYRCVTIVSVYKGKREYEHTLAGEKGEIWAYDDLGTMKAFIALPSGHEKIYTFDIKDLEKWISNVKVPGIMDQQLYWANNPNERHL